MKKYYVYADEATFERASDQIVGTGIFVSETPISKGVIELALQDLENDSDFDNRNDFATTGRGYFHASADSKNAHSHFCRRIVEFVSGNFVYSYFNKTDQKKRTIEHLNRLTLQLVCQKFLNEPCEIEIIVEERNGFSQNNVSLFLQTFSNNISLIASEHPSIINIFPKIEMTVMGKGSPGLQVVDFMLWATNRLMMQPPNTVWHERLKLKMSDHFRVEDDSQFGGDYYLNKKVLDYAALAHMRINYPYQIPADIPVINRNIIDYYNHIEQLIIHVNNQGIPPHALHLQKAVDQCIDIISGKFLYNQINLKYVCFTFIQLFDTLPLYKEVEDNREEEWLNLLFDKKLAGIIIRDGGIHNARTRNYILRSKWMDESPNN